MNTRPRPMEGMQRIMTTFKHFDKKLDKLQNDVKYHGQTLSDLRAMMTRLSGGAIISADRKLKRPSKRPSVLKEDTNEPSYVEEPPKLKKKKAAQPPLQKTKTDSFESHHGKRLEPDSSSKMHKRMEIESETSARLALRHKKVDSIKKDNTRPKKIVERKRSKLTKIKSNGSH